MSDNDAGKANINPSTPADKPVTDASKPSSSSSSSSAGAASTSAPNSKRNPAFRALGLPNWRLRLPSRNWTIFLSIVGSFSGAIYYDRRQKKAVQKKWCTLVEHVANESLPTNSLARRVTIILAAPPGDGLRSARGHFTEYVKPILVAGALDWDVIEGRREGEVRRGTADRIRRLRRKNGEYGGEELERDVPTALAEIRERSGIQDYQGPTGDVVIGRHTWKEYIRGLHEGWLGPIDLPKQPVEASPELGDTPEDGTSPSDINTENEKEKLQEKEKEKEEEKKPPQKPARPPVPPAHNQTSSYTDSSLPPSCPEEFQPSIPIPFPHILGFLNTPTRIYRFLTRRYLADEVGRQAAAVVLAAHRPYSVTTDTTGADGAPTNQSFDDAVDTMRQFDSQWEQQTALNREEADWNKQSRKRKDGEKERVWLDRVVVDSRIGERMRKFQLEPGQEERARWIGKGVAGIPGRTDGDDGGLEKD